MEGDAQREYRFSEQGFEYVGPFVPEGQIGVGWETEPHGMTQIGLYLAEPEDKDKEGLWLCISTRTPFMFSLMPVTSLTFEEAVTLRKALHAIFQTTEMEMIDSQSSIPPLNGLGEY